MKINEMFTTTTVTKFQCKLCNYVLYSENPDEHDHEALLYHMSTHDSTDDENDCNCHELDYSGPAT